MVIKTMKAYIKEILDKRNNLSEEEYHIFSQKICQNAKSLNAFKTAKNLLVFYPYLKEADILPIALSAMLEGKNVFFPKVTGETTMDFIKAETMNDFSSGYKGIKEPNGAEVFNKYNISEKTVMILPGSAFDKSGNRAGYGKGYYDRYLENCYEKITKIGVCFSLQILHEISDVKATDIPMDYVINEKTIIRRDK